MTIPHLLSSLGDVSSSVLNNHYAKLLGLEAPWHVLSVDIDIPALRIRIAVDWENGKSVTCPECHAPCSIQDHREERSWRHLDTMQFETVLTAKVPRSNCRIHGVKTISVPWAGPSSRFTLLFEVFAIKVIQASKSITAARSLLHLSWDQIHAVMARAVERGLERRSLNELRYAGIDEKSFLKGHDYITLLNDLDQGRVLDVMKDRTTESAEMLWKTISHDRRGCIQAVAMDMWDPFMTATAAMVPSADIVHDKFHVASYLGKAVDEVRRKEHKELRRMGSDLLTGSKYLWLTNPKNWSKDQRASFRALKDEHLKVARAWSMKELFQKFWVYTYEKSATAFFKSWYFWATHSKLKPFIQVANMLKRHFTGLLSYLKHRITNAVTEGLNSKIQSIKANARGFRNFQNYRIAILFHCGKLDMFPC